MANSSSFRNECYGGILMREVVMFAEDFGHEAVIGALLDRHAREFEVQITLNKYSVRGGHGQAVSEFKKYLCDLKRSSSPQPDLLVVAIDSNCRGFNDCYKELESIVQDLPIPRLLAIPDPHIERWLLLDSAAFKAALGKGCNAPDLKCDRARYKTLLTQAVREAGLTPLIGGIEHAEDIISAMDLRRMRKGDRSLAKFLEDRGHIFQEWASR